MKNIIKINESDLRKMIAESVEQILGGGEETRVDIGKELQLFLNDMKYSLFKKGESSSPTKRDYMIAKHFYELGKKGETLNEVGGYDMNTPEGRRGVEDWMNYIMDQEDRRPAIAAQNWAEENGLDGDENIIKAFIAGVEYGRDL